MTSEQIFEEFEKKLENCDTVEIHALSELASDAHFAEEAGDEFNAAVAYVRQQRPRKGKHAKD